MINNDTIKIIKIIRFNSKIVAVDNFDFLVKKVKKAPFLPILTDFQKPQKTQKPEKTGFFDFSKPMVNPR
jgi:hypothetical protein